MLRNVTTLLLALAALTGIWCAASAETLVLGGGLDLPVYAAAEDTVRLPIWLNGGTGAQVYSAQITLATDSSLISFVAIRHAGTRSAGWSSAVSPLPSDSMRVAMAGTNPLSATGALCTLVVTVRTRFAATDAAPVNVRSAVLNEGAPACAAVPTYVTGNGRALLFIRDTTALSNVRVTLPVYASAVVGRGVYSADFRVIFNSSKLTCDSAYVAPALPASWAGAAINRQTGYVQVSMAGSDPLVSPGPLLYLVLRPTTAKGNDTIALGLSAARFNEGVPAVSARSATIRVQGSTSALERRLEQSILRMRASGDGLVRYSLSRPSQVSISLCDLTGRVVHTSRAMFQQAGQQIVALPLAGLATGPYVLSVAADGFHAMCPVIITTRQGI